MDKDFPNSFYFVRFTVEYIGRVKYYCYLDKQFDACVYYILLVVIYPDTQHPRYLHEH